MQRISGASRHCPLLVIELARDMSSEPNTDTAISQSVSQLFQLLLLCDYFYFVSPITHAIDKTDDIVPTELSSKVR